MKSVAYVAYSSLLLVLGSFINLGTWGKIIYFSLKIEVTYIKHIASAFLNIFSGW